MDDPDKTLTGIAFLIVCDMLLTGFDAPVEQVMYIDKKLQEHNLLQAIARVNRVAEGKERGFIVDYIGLANHLTRALSIYAQEDAAGHRRGPQEHPERTADPGRALPAAVAALQVRGGRTRSRASSQAGSQDAAEDVAVVHAALAVLKDIRQRADFEVYLKKFLQSLNLILPDAAGHAYRGPAARFGYLLQMAKERYKDESMDFGDAGKKVKALINEHLISLGINPKIPPIELLSDDFVANVQKHALGERRGQGERDGTRHPQALHHPLR